MRPWHHPTGSEIGIARECRQRLVANHERILVDLWLGPSRVEPGRVELKVKAPQLLVDVARGKRDVEVEPAQTLRTPEELVQRHPEQARPIVVRRAQGTEGVRIARALDRQEGGVANRLHWKREGVIRLAGEEVALSRV